MSGYRHKAGCTCPWCKGRRPGTGLAQGSTWGAKIFVLGDFRARQLGADDLGTLLVMLVQEVYDLEKRGHTIRDFHCWNNSQQARKEREAAKEARAGPPVDLDTTRTVISGAGHSIAKFRFPDGSPYREAFDQFVEALKKEGTQVYDQIRFPEEASKKP